MTSLQPETVWRPSRELTLARLRPHAPLAGLLALTAVLYLWGLSRLGTANDFYAAAVKSGTESWKAFLFGSFDSAGYITVDKPPASLWLMELSARAFGFSSFSLLLPQALEGVATVALLYAAVRRFFPASAALLAGLVLAVTPVAALMFRYDNPDALLVLLLVAAAYAVTRALEHASTAWLALAGAAVGIGFLTKMMQSFVVVPALAAAYLLAAPAPLRRRIRQLLLAGLAIVAAGGWWVALVELWPAGSRPYIGGSTNNSILDLVWGYNGLGRIDGGGGGAAGGPGGSFSGTPGVLRLFDLEMGGQISWLLPAALVVLGAGAVWTPRRPRTDRTRAALVLWGGWLVLAGVVYSLMSGIIHPYYTNTLAPPIAVLVGVGGIALWRMRASFVARLLIAFAVTATAAWSYRLLDRTPDWHPWLRVAVLVAGLGAAAAMVALPVPARRVGATVAAVVLLAVLAGPAAYTLDTVATASTGSLVSAGPATAGGRGGFGPGGPETAGRASSALTRLLARSSPSYRWAAATSSSMTAAPLELATGKAVMAIGGFNGGDDAITLARFKKLVAKGEIHYYVTGGAGGGGPRRPGAAGGSSAIESWVANTFAARTVGGATVYDLSS